MGMYEDFLLFLKLVCIFNCMIFDVGRMAYTSII